MQIPLSHQHIKFTVATLRLIKVNLDGAEGGDAGVFHLMKTQWIKLEEVHLCPYDKM